MSLKSWDMFQEGSGLSVRTAVARHHPYGRRGLQLAQCKMEGEILTEALQN